MTSFNELLKTGAYPTYLEAVNADESMQRGKVASEKFGEDFPLPTTIDPEAAAAIAANFTQRALLSAAKIKSNTR